jgi:DNA-binding GntR family transcriptional regulator
MTRASDKAYKTIKQQILDGVLFPGFQLKEEELADMCGVSRTPIRDAIKRLETEMFIHRSDSQRSYVAEWSIGDVEDLFTLRAMLEGHAAARAAERATPLTIVELRRHVAVIDDAVSLPLENLDMFVSANLKFHALILEASASSRLAYMINRLILQPVVHRTAVIYDLEQWKRSLTEHSEIVAAIVAHDAEWARAVMTAHIKRAFHIYRDDLRRNDGEGAP